MLLLSIYRSPPTNETTLKIYFTSKWNLRLAKVQATLWLCHVLNTLVPPRILHTHTELTTRVFCEISSPTPASNVQHQLTRAAQSNHQAATMVNHRVTYRRRNG